MEKKTTYVVVYERNCQTLELPFDTLAAAELFAINLTRYGWKVIGDIRER